MHLPRLAKESDAAYRIRFNKKWNKRAKEAASLGPQVRLRDLPPAEKAKLLAEIERLQKLFTEREARLRKK